MPAHHANHPMWQADSATCTLQTLLKLLDCPLGICQVLHRFPGGIKTAIALPLHQVLQLVPCSNTLAHHSVNFKLALLTAGCEDRSPLKWYGAMVTLQEADVENWMHLTQLLR